MAPDPDPGELKLAGRPAKKEGRPGLTELTRSTRRLGKWVSYQVSTQPPCPHSSQRACQCGSGTPVYC
jgi:hypothetical protein